jgi:hypothetical protein
VEYRIFLYSDISTPSVAPGRFHEKGSKTGFRQSVSALRRGSEAETPDAIELINPFSGPEEELVPAFRVAGQDKESGDKSLFRT